MSNQALRSGPVAFFLAMIAVAPASAVGAKVSRLDVGLRSSSVQSAGSAVIPASLALPVGASSPRALPLVAAVVAEPLRPLHGAAESPAETAKLFDGASHSLSAEILQARRGYRDSGRHWARLWNQQGGEWRFTSARLASLPAGGHAVYFSSGFDVYRFLADFPTAKHYHLVDAGLVLYENVDSEISARLRALAPDAVVEVVDRGYAASLPEAVLAPLRDKAHASSGEPVVPSEVGIRRPMVLRAHWSSPGHGKREVYFHLHPFSYSSPTTLILKDGVRYDPSQPLDLSQFDRLEKSAGEIGKFLATLPRGAVLLGAMQIGGSPIFFADMDALLDRIVPGGLFVTEKAAKGGSPPPELQWISRFHEERHLETLSSIELHRLDPFLSDEDEGPPSRLVPVIAVKKR